MPAPKCSVSADTQRDRWAGHSLRHQLPGLEFRVTTLGSEEAVLLWVLVTQHLQSPWAECPPPSAGHSRVPATPSMFMRQALSRAHPVTWNHGRHLPPFLAAPFYTNFREWLKMGEGFARPVRPRFPGAIGQGATFDSKGDLAWACTSVLHGHLPWRSQADAEYLASGMPGHKPALT